MMPNVSLSLQDTCIITIMKHKQQKWLYNITQLDYAESMPHEMYNMCFIIYQLRLRAPLNVLRVHTFRTKSHEKGGGGWLKTSGCHFD